MPIQPPFDLPGKFRAVSKMLRAAFDAHSVGGTHPYEKGMRREAVVTDFLQRHLPPCYGVARGELVDSRGWGSRQIDVVIYDAFHSPLLQETEASRLFPAEAVYAAIEVKPVLSLGDLEEAVAAVTSAKRLDRSALVSQHHGHRLYGPNQKNMAPFTVLFAFQCATPVDRLAAELSQLHRRLVPEGWLDCLCVLDRGLVYHFEQRPVRTGGVAWVPTVLNEKASVGYYELGDDTLLLFYLFLLYQLHCRDLFPADLLRYARFVGRDLLPTIVGPNVTPPPAPGKPPAR
ncbi:MAG TPA: hypothetical protein PLE19_03525 [Planctomycetota bacterium]|nr:hypothetical protein [Planctomycetota bacterium]HRR78632.1 hypothetical protein [Planctomycetota bacterium]HRT97325.1 hypothetical protein [Planctomycetota bacterium]